MHLVKATSFEDRYSYLNTLKNLFFERAEEVDRTNRFVTANIEDLKACGYTALTVPREYGGSGISLYELVRFQEKIAEGDGATALSIGWHMGIIKNEAEKHQWNEKFFHVLCEKVMNGALVNSAASEAVTGSPTRGGKPATTAVKKGDQWLINGRKTFTTMAPVLDYFFVTATIEATDQVGNFLIPRTVNGVSIEETWNSIAMRGTGSHDLLLNNVSIPAEHLLEIINKKAAKASGWLLHIPACYLGIAQAAQNEAVHFAQHYSPNSITGTIAELPNVQEKIGRIELELMKARSFLYDVAKKWDQAADTDRERLLPQLSAVKMSVTNSAIHIVDLAMRIVGAKSLSMNNPLQRLYRDVRAGLHNPPMDDMTLTLLAKSKLKNS
ncbi:acyl-CoA/acyl-ACP dehydrogenase [Bacillaceae bacterium Marseille-Q3522]|nr:acyl-CoA/acyl-ACP dehydrogenase [Bacillaceae bacterium Marseille-Q3522]